MKRALFLAAAAALLVGCAGAAETPAATSGATAAPTSGAAIDVVETITVTDPWVKATDEGAHMTGVFAELTNVTGADVHVVAVTAGVTERAELHEMIDQAGTPVMSQMPDGFVIPANGSFTLEPGGNHVMLMELMEPIEPGMIVPVTLEFADGGSVTFDAVARTYAGANEEYDGDDGMNN